MLRTVNAFIGDFDVQVDFDALDFPFISTGYGELRAYLLDPGPANSVTIGRRRQFSTDDYIFHQSVDGDYGEITSTADLGHETGKFRLTRVGTLFTAYYWDGGWQAVGSTTHFAGPVVIDLLARNSLNHPLVRFAYDNFQITADAMTRDCNANLIDDVLDHANCDGSAWCDDCNSNGILDGCDLDLGAKHGQPTRTASPTSVTPAPAACPTARAKS